MGVRLLSEVEELQALLASAGVFIVTGVTKSGTTWLQRMLDSHPEIACGGERSEEHTSELQSLMRISYAVFCLKKKKTKTTNVNITSHNKNINKKYITERTTKVTIYRICSLCILRQN